MKLFGTRILLICLALLMVLMGTTSFAEEPMDADQPVMIQIDPSVSGGKSGLSLGVTNTHSYWEYGNATAVSRAKELLNGTSKFQNQAIMGWGADYLQKNPGDPINFSSLDHRINLMRELGGEMVLTLCTAPGWMKTKGDDWNMDDRVADEYVDDFAALTAAIAERYPDVKYFVVWNEFKGYWNSSITNSDGSRGNWDYVRYTDLYNAVYTAIKEARPDAMVGGYYVPVTGDGSSTLGYKGANTSMPLISRDLDSMNYWLEHKAGADFIALDRWLKDWNNPNNITLEDSLKLSYVYGKVIEQFRERTDLPIWFPEYYTLTYAEPGSQYVAAAMGSIYYHKIKSGAGREMVSLLWNPAPGEWGVAHNLFTSTNGSNGGMPTPHYFVFKGVSDYFSAGTELVKATSSDPSVEVLASQEKVMLVNKNNADLDVLVNGRLVSLGAWEVRFIDTAEVVVSIDSIRSILDQYFDSGELKHPLYKQLTNRLDQAAHHYGKGDVDQARKHLEDFLKHLNNGAMEKNVTVNAKNELETEVELLMSGAGTGK